MYRAILTGAVLALGAAACGNDAAPPDVPVADNEQVQNRGANKDNWWDALPREEWAAYEAVPQSQDWFEVYRVSEGIHAVYEPGQFEEVISFLITGRDRALLFDTGLGIGDMRQVVSELTDLDVVVVNSHTHYDHIGGNHQFDTVYAVDTDYTRERAAGSSPEAVAGFLREGWVWKDLPAGFEPETFRSEPYEIDKYLQDGEVIDLGGRELEVVLVPGHAPDALVLLDREHRLVFTGDTFYLAPLYTHLEGSDFDRYAESAALLASLKPAYDKAYTAHNVPIVDGSYLVAMDQAFRAIQAGTHDDWVLSDGNREYFFDGFSIIVAGDAVD